MNYRNFIMALARGARGKEAAKALILPEIFGGTGSVNSGVEAKVSGTPPLSLPNSLGKPLKAWSVDLVPYQEGSGEASPTNIRTIHGTDKINWFVEETYDQSATPKTVINLASTVYNATIGSDGGESRWGSVTLNGISPAFAGSGDQIYGLLNQMVHSLNYSQKIICDKLPVFSRHDSIEFKRADYGITGYADSNNRYPNSNWLYVKIAGCTTPADVNAWLAANNVTCVYERVNSAPIAITTPPIPTPTGTATAWATAEDGIVDGMKVTYVGKA